MGRWFWLVGGGIAALAMLAGGVWMSFDSTPPAPVAIAPSVVPVPSSPPASPLVPKSPSPSPSVSPSRAAPSSAAAPVGLPNPDGANLALRKPAIASGVQEPFVASSAVDGDPGTRWGSAFTDSQWIRVDLGSLHQISAVKLTWETSYAVAYSIQVSTDARTWKSIYSTKSGKGGTETLSDLDATGRYVRILCTKRSTQYGFSLFELGVF